MFENSKIIFGGLSLYIFTFLGFVENVTRLSWLLNLISGRYLIIKHITKLIGLKVISVPKAKVVALLHS